MGLEKRLYKGIHNKSLLISLHNIPNRDYKKQVNKSQNEKNTYIIETEREI